MRILAHEGYLQLREGARVIEADRHGDKVLLLPDSTYVKLFRRKRILSSAAFYPYARRFADNIQALTACGIPCPQLIALYRIPAIARDAIHYLPLDGHTVRQIVKERPGAAEAERLRGALGAFVAGLHERGVYFRSLHLGNIVRRPDGTFGLIDLADMRMRSARLGQLLRARNLKHLLRYPEEADWLCEHGTFFAAYNQASGLRMGR